MSMHPGTLMDALKPACDMLADGRAREARLKLKDWAEWSEHTGSAHMSAETAALVLELLAVTDDTTNRRTTMDDLKAAAVKVLVDYLQATMPSDSSQQRANIALGVLQTIGNSPLLTPKT